MIGTILAAGIPTVFVATWMILARSMFRRWRIGEAEKRACPKRATLFRHNEDCGTCRAPIHWWQDGDKKSHAEGYCDADLTFLAIVQAFWWPLFIAPYLMGKFIRYNPTKAPSEIKAENERLTARTEALEAENKRLEKNLEDAR